MATPMLPIVARGATFSTQASFARPRILASALGLTSPMWQFFCMRCRAFKACTFRVASHFCECLLHAASHLSECLQHGHSAVANYGGRSSGWSGCTSSSSQLTPQIVRHASRPGSRWRRSGHPAGFFPHGLAPILGQHTGRWVCSVLSAPPEFQIDPSVLRCTPAPSSGKERTAVALKWLHRTRRTAALKWRHIVLQVPFFGATLGQLGSRSLFGPGIHPPFLVGRPRSGFGRSGGYGLGGREARPARRARLFCRVEPHLAQCVVVE
jgi:hypothetical protein